MHCDIFETDEKVQVSRGFSDLQWPVLFFMGDLATVPYLQWFSLRHKGFAGKALSDLLLSS